jgi:DeoR/GlpR family transcriptional regulator of sugar metabolism
VLASSEKLATASPYRIVGLSEVSGIVVPAAASEEVLRPYREMGIALTLAAN